ncbi:MAG: hydroxymethylbilane synthase [Alphaproteobacteria bacterium]
MTEQSSIVIGTRGSPLALAQAHQVRDALQAAHKGLVVEVEVVITKGDRITDRPLLELGGKGLFTQEIEAGLLDGRFDLAVHSLKDVETNMPDGLSLIAHPKREDPRDALIAAEGINSLADIPEGAVVGTASLRRGAQLLRARPDLTVEPLRGNVQTRLEKVRRGDVAASFLAMAGLNRLGLGEEASAAIPVADMMPAPGQGIIALQGRSDDSHVLDLVGPLNDAASFYEALAERAALKALDGDCRTPIAAHAVYAAGEVMLTAELLLPDGSAHWRAEGSAPASEAEALGAELGAKIKAQQS